MYTTTKFLNSQGVARVRSSQFRSLFSENTITYNKIFDKHRISALGGFTYQNFHNTYIEGNGSGFISDINQTYELQAARTAGITLSAYVNSTIISYLGRLNYSYDDKILATVSFRSDGASKYTEGNKWGYFPSGASRLGGPTPAAIEALNQVHRRAYGYSPLVPSPIDFNMADYNASNFLDLVI